MISEVAVSRLAAREREAFIAANPRSRSAFKRSLQHWHDGVPFHWMRDWPSPFPLVAAHAQGAVLTSLDGHQLDDFCLGDTASMFGHSPAPLASAIAGQATCGLSYMLPTENGERVAERLAAIFGLPFWQVTTSASEANRAIIRWARAITGRKRILIFNGCYHGAVDDVFVDLRDGRAAMRPSLIGQVYDLLPLTEVVEFNDRAALATALESGDIACVLAEPVMTNIGMVLPEPGFLDYVREATRATGTLLVWDETHTISSGFGGHAVTHKVMADMTVIGKSIGGGIACAVYGFSHEIAQAMAQVNAGRPPGHSGIGTTLSANALSLAAMRAMLEHVITADAYAHMLSMAARLVEGLDAAIDRHGLDWHVANVGARVEFVCTRVPPRNGSEARAAMKPALEAAIHLYLVNRGVLLAPFHNMCLLSPSTMPAQVDRLCEVLDGCIAELKG